MNKRIKKLIEQAWVQANLACNQDPKANWAEIRDEKFAELILTEVISTIYGSDISDKKQEKLVDELSYKFGFKE